jgi:predicted SAM-dependent methyltransferase
MTDQSSTHARRKLHLGCGGKFIPGFIHVDLTPLPHVDHVADVKDLTFAETNSVDLIYASHVLEHFGRAEHLDVLREWWRVLKPGGVLRLSVPDFAACAALYYEQGLVDGLSGLVGLVSGGQRNAFDFHKMIFDRDLLTKSLLASGFSQVRPWDWRATEHAAIDDYSQAYLPHLDKTNGRHMSLNLEGLK